jgi:1,4-dihydroxy-2-naphthoyl-CoA hydrolase
MSDELNLTQLLNERGRGALAEAMGIELIEVSAERVVATMPVQGNTQPYGLLHGGASAVLVETLGSLAAAVHGGPTKQALGLNINVTHHKSATSGLVTGVATPMSLGNTIAAIEVVVSDQSGARIATGQLTCLLRPIRTG